MKILIFYFKVMKTCFGNQVDSVSSHERFLYLGFFVWAWLEKVMLHIYIFFIFLFYILVHWVHLYTDFDLAIT